MRRFIETVKKLEDEGWSTSAKNVASYLRKLVYKGAMWNLACGFTDTVWKTGLEESDITLLTNMMRHDYKSSTGIEKGVVLTQNGTVALGHVITGISCGGFNRDTQMTIPQIYGSTSSRLDNLFFSTVSGDLGQTALQYHSSPTTYRLLGPAGHWNNESFPEVYTLSSKESEMTDAEVLGDMDGTILGTIIPTIQARKWKLSHILRDYYQNGGVRVGERVFRAADRTEIFGELLTDVELEYQSVAFAEVYYKKYKDRFGGASKASLVRHVPSAVQAFYKTYVPCTDKLKIKYTMKYFVDLVKMLEKETGLGVVAMTRAIVGVSEYFKTSYYDMVLDVRGEKHKYTDGFDWYVLHEMMTHGFSRREPRRELGVIEAGGDVVAIGHVLAGIHAGRDGGSSSNLYGATMAGSFAQAAVHRNSARNNQVNIMGATGKWIRTFCPPRYLLKKEINVQQHTTRAELLGDIDGFVLGHRVSDWLKTDPGLKLSTALERYYGTDFIPVSSQVRFDQFKNYVDKSKLVTETTNACITILRKEAAIFQSVDTSFCKGAAESAVKEFYGTVPLSNGKYLVGLICKAKIHPTNEYIFL